MAKLDVFVSHLTVEAKFADLLRERLDRDFIGLLNPFISTDATSIPVGTNWFDRVMKGIAAAQLQFVICSPDSVRLPWINYETGAARARDVEIVPLCHSGISPNELPVPLSMSQGLLLSEGEGLRKLYERISQVLSSSVPAVDFEGYAAEFRALEDEYANQRNQDTAASGTRTAESIVNDPRVVCVSSDQFIELGFKNQLEVVLNAFPQNLQHDVVRSRRDLETLLMTEHVHILHISTFVCPRSGGLYFSPVDLQTGSPIAGNVELLPAEALAALIKTAGTRLVVIASGNSLALITTLLAVTNVIAPRDIVSAQALAIWVQTFYDTLRIKPLADACEYAASASRVPMRLLAQQAEIPEISFRGQARDATVPVLGRVR